MTHVGGIDRRPLLAETNEFELSLADLTRLSKSIRTLGAHASSREEVAQRIASFLHDGFRDPESGQTCCALVRLFHTQRFGSLPPSLQGAALGAGDRDELDDDVRCLTLIGTAGDHPDWASRRRSRGHQAIPLVSEAAIAQLPMVYQLLLQLGIDPVALVASDRELMLDLERRTFNVFFVPEARGSRFIPAQSEFVERFGVRAVVGYGSVLPDGEMNAVVMFWKRHLSGNSAGMFRTLALSTKVALLADMRRPIFETCTANGDLLFAPWYPESAPSQPSHLDSLTRALRELLEMHEVTVLDQAQRLEDTLASLLLATGGLESQIAELADKNRELGRRNQELDEFTYIASHDLQEPLRKLCAYADLLETDLGGAIPDRAREDLGFIVDAAQRMQVLIQDLLSLSRTSRKVLDLGVVHMDACVEQALGSLSIALEESGARVQSDLLPPVLGDHTLLMHLYQNLIGNALKFCDPSRAPVVHLTHNVDEAGRSVFGVRDNGIGIPVAYREQIFAPFRRLHGRGEYAGSGIGLAICRRAVERLGGEIWVEPAEDGGVGSHFQFTLRTAVEPESSKGETADAS